MNTAVLDTPVITPNIEALNTTLAYLRKYPEQHDQGHWGSKNACGTSMCMAGAAVHTSQTH